MGAYILRRIGIGIVVVFLVSIVAFVGVAMAPGDSLTAQIGPTALAELSPAQLAQKKHDLGLDRPVPVRYGTWLNGVLHGNLGYSTSDSMPVGRDLRTHVGPTLLLMAAALLVGIVIALPLGIIAAVREHSWADYALATVPLVLIGIPSFVLGLLGIYALSVKLALLPTGGMHDLGDGSPIDLLRHLVLPSCVLAVTVAAPLIRYTRSGMLDALRADYIITARSKGISNRLVTVRHAFRNALVPVITVIGLLVAELVAGTVIVEQVFNWPGLGQLAVHAAGNRDSSVMLGIILLVGCAVVVVNVLTDIATARADPRIRID